MQRMGMSTENVQIKRPAKPFTYVIIYFNDNDEKNKYVISANMVKKELRGRKNTKSQSMDAEKRFLQRRLEYIKCCIHMRHGIDLAEQILKTRVSRWTNSGKNMSKRLPHVPQALRS